MARVLIADADSTQNMRIGFALTAEHEVELAANGRDAIDRGITFRPDVLLVDWLSKGFINGVEVSESVRSIHPETRPILITAFASKELRKATKEASFLGFLEKPLDPQKLQDGIQNVLTSEPPKTNRTIAFVEYETSGMIAHANQKARELLDLKDSGETITDVLSYRSQNALSRPKAEWFSLSRKGEKSSKLEGFVKKNEEGKCFLFVLHRQERGLKASPLVERLIGQDSAKASCPIPQRLLVVDENDLQRKLACSELEKLNCQFYSSETHEGAFRILEAYTDVRIVILDYGKVDDDLAAVVERMRLLCPNLTIVGTSTEYRKEEFEALGVDHFLPKPLVGSTLVERLWRCQISPA